MFKKITLIIPYYNAPKMLEKQLSAIRQYPEGIQVFIVDDCSKIPASKVVKKNDPVNLFRIETDLAWNREGARNLGSALADTEWIMHIDIDHLFKPSCARALLNTELNTENWYRFERFRIGKADETRKKDLLPDHAEYGRVKPHIDSYLCTKELYWKAGGYNEDYVGCLGGGSPFLKNMEKEGGSSKLLHTDVFLHVYTRDKVPDASVSDLSRDTAEYQKRRKQIGTKKGVNPLRFDWVQII